MKNHYRLSRICSYQLHIKKSSKDVKNKFRSHSKKTKAPCQGENETRVHDLSSG